MATQVSAAANEPAVARITGQWVQPPAEVTKGQPLVAQWLVEVDAPEDATTSAHPLEDLTAELTLENGTFADIPEQCLVAGTDSPSELSDDGRTLSCNVGTKGAQTSAAIQTLVTAEGADGEAVTGRGAIGDEEATDLPPVTINDPNAGDEPETTDPEPTEPETTAPEATEPDAPTADAPTEEPDEKPDEAAEAPTAAEGDAVALSTNPAGTFITQANVFYAYVDAGENVDIAFTKAADQGAAAVNVTITVRRPGAAPVSCTRLAADAVGTACTWNNLTAGSPGVWQVNFTPAGGGATDQFRWRIDVQDGTTTVPGRVYSQNYVMNQTGAPTDLSLWYQSEQGFLYRGDYTGYQGAASIFNADATGVALLDTCVSAYESMDTGGPFSDAARLWRPPAGECGDPYKIFFESPDPGLPASATLWNGTTTTWLQPPVALPELSSLAFTPDGPTTRTGDFTFDVVNFTGQVDVQVDVNNDGDFGDPEDVTIPAAVTEDGTVTVPFDGRDGQGRSIPSTQPLNARVAITQAGEIHFANGDVERRGGIAVEALNGPEAGSTTLYWNDTTLRVAERNCTTPVFDGRAGVDSASGVHGWTCSQNANDGRAGSWGDVRVIDDWTYHTIDESQTLAIPPGDPLPTWECGSNAPGLLFQADTGDVASSAHFVDLVTGGYDTPVTLTGLVNATGYNVADDFVYGNADGQLVRIGSDGNMEVVGVPLTGGSVVGDVDDNGHYWNYNSATGLWIDADLATGTTVTGTAASPAPATTNGQDWAYIPGTNKLWRVASNGAGTLSYLLGFDRTTHTWTTPVSLGNLGGAGSGNVVGAVFADADGFLYASYNNTGQIYRVDIDAGTAAFFANGPSSSGNDGARCADSPILVDFGDARNGYRTTLASDGPRHGLPGYDEATGTAPLMLGSSVDPETDGVPGASASGDGADEDAVAGPITTTTGSPTTVTVAVTNTTGAAATLAGWIDRDGDGIFEAGERVTAAVAPGATSVDLTFPAPIGYADTVARFRLFPGTVANPLPTGPAAAGEVEDHLVAGPVLPPFECPPEGFLFQVPESSTTTSGHAIDMVSGAFTTPYTIANRSLNAIGYNTADDYIYAWDGVANEIVRVGSDGNVFGLGAPAGMPAAAVDLGFAVGDVDDNNHYWVYVSATGAWYEIDLATNTVVDSGTAPTPTVLIGNDWAFIEGTNKLWRVGTNSARTASFLVGFDRTTETWTTPVSLGSLADNSTGASFVDADGYLYVSYNVSGNIYRVDPVAGTATFFSDGPAAPGNDGTRCADAPIPIDFGDAQNGYRTTLASDGPRHGVPGYNAGANTAPLMLGGSIDIETDGVPGASAQGDDAADVDDEDALAGPLVLSRATPTTVSVAVTNTTGAAATLAGWVDLDGDGTFEPGERATATVPAGATSVDLTFPAGTAAGGTLARFRLFPGAVANPLPTGPAAAGEVEDHPATIEPVLPPPFECTSTAYLFQRFPTDVFEGDLVTGQFFEEASDIEDAHINGIGFNPLDGFIYGWSNSTEPGGGTFPTGLVRVGSDYSVQYLGLAGLPATTLIGHGDVDTDGHYWARRTDITPNEWVEIDLEPGSPTFGEVLDNGTLALPAGYTLLPDWSFNPDDGAIYGTATGFGSMHLVRFDRTTHLPTVVGPLAGMPVSSYGATYMDPNGYLYASDNASGRIYRIDVSDVSATLFAQGPGGTVQNDGARCATAPLPVDFGDAVNGYGTTLAADGARHSIPGFDSGTSTAPLMLGTRIDIDTDGVPGASAQGDDTDGLDDEDALLGPIGLVIGQPTVVPVRVTNDTTGPATLAGWIDLNDDGDFADPGELQRVVVPGGSGLTTQTLTFPAVGAPGDGTFARFRLFPGDVAAANLSPTGPAAAGEVEDYTAIGPVPIFLECPNVYALQGASPFNVYEVDTASGAMTSVGQMGITGGSGNNNAQGISPDGRYIFTVRGGVLWQHDTYTGDTEDFPGAGITNATHGAVDLSTGLYYYGTTTSTGATFYGFDPSTGTLLGQVATVTWDINAPGTGGNGDMAFDAQGNLYVVAGEAPNSALYVISEPLPTDPGSEARSGQRIATFTTGTDSINGMAFDGQGYLYVASGNNILQLNPSSGAEINREALTPSSASVDLASCSSPASITVQKDVVGRFAAGNQFQVSVTGGGISTGNTGTTAGTDVGIQDGAAETAGPVLGLPGTTYTIGETGAGGTNLANYEIEWECVNESDGDAVVASGTGASGTFTMPDSIAGIGASVVCTITNEPIALDFGDAPSTYGTTAGANGARHSLPGLTGTTAPVMLGSSVDGEADGQPNAAADGDGADEDGVDFNAALGYPDPTLRTGTDPVTGLPAVNTLDVEASADGFVSVWVDWNMDGDFADAGEQVANAAAVTAGTNPITFPQGTNPPGIDTYVRVRYSTDAASVATPTGPAPDGEVEDYAVLVERLVQPDTCLTGDQTFYAFTFGTPVNGSPTGGGIGSNATYQNVSVVDGVAIDMHVEVVAGQMKVAGGGAAPPNGFGMFAPDDVSWNVESDATLRYTFYEAGTTNPVPVSAVFTMQDMDSIEAATFSAADLFGYGVTQGSTVRIVESGGDVTFDGTSDGAAAPEQRFQVSFADISSFEARWQGFSGSGFAFDGDGDVSIDPPACDDYGDAPDTYDTTLASNGPRHTVTSGVRLGSTLDFDPDGQPTPGADGDDTNRLADEDGVDFNAALGYPDPTLRTGTDPVTGLPAVNTLDVEASADGFVSVWVDWNMDGDFLDAGEQVANAAAVTAGTNPITFPQGTNSPGIDTYVRVRYSTDAASIATPTGPAPDGEVEDYAVLVERLNPPQVCSTSDGEQYAFTFSEPTSRTGTGGVGSTARYSRVSVIDGVPVDMVAEVVAGSMRPDQIPPNGLGVGLAGTGIDPDDARFQINADATIRYTFYEAGTTTPVPVGAAFTVNDMDGTGQPVDETATFDAADLAAYGVSQGSGVQITTPGDDVVFKGTTAGAGTITQRFQFVIEGISTFDVAWHGFSGSGFGFDGDGDLSIQPVGCEDYGDAPETYDTTAAAGGPSHTVTNELFMGSAVEFDPNGQPTPGADGDDTNRVDDEDGPTGPISLTPGATTDVTIDVVNTTGGPATLAGWIDLDGSGTFDAGELVSVPVAASGPYTLTFPAGTVTADTYARFRLYPGTPTAITPGGPASAGEVEDHLVEVFTTEVDKSVGSVVANADGTHTVTYEIDVTRTGDGGPYDLDDTFMAGSAVTVVGPVTATNTVPGDITTRTEFDGQADRRIVEDVAIADGETHTYEVTVVIEVDTAALTFENSDCTLGGGEAGTGFMNRATATVDGATVEDDACREISVPTHDKVVSAGPTPQGNGLYRIDYTITVTNAGAAASEYDLEDELLYGDAITISGDPIVTNTSPGTITPNPGWDGETDIVVVEDQAIGAGAPGAPNTHTYSVVVFVTVDGDAVTFENSDCTLGSGETGTGLLNETTMTVDAREETDEACPPPLAEPTHTKDVVSGPTALGNGRYEVEYQITVTNPSSGPGVYDLGDELRYGDAVTIEDGPFLTPPAGVTPNAGWDGQTVTEIVTDQAIPAGTAGTPATHVYTVRVEVSIDGAEATAEDLDCTLDPGESGTGLLNTATISVNGEDVDDDACPPPPATPVHSKVVSSGPTAAGNGLWDIEYTITVTNPSPTAGTYDLDDAFTFGGAVTIEGDPTVTASPAGITPDPDWNGQDQTVIVTDEPIAAGAPGAPTVHTYVVTVQVSIDETAVTFENSDCTLGSGETGTGLLNSATVTVDGAETQETACPPPPAAPRHTKDVVSGPTALGGGRYELLYEITVTNPSAGAGEYDLRDELTYGEAVTIEAGPTLTPPAGVTPNAGWDGQTDTVIIDDQAIGAGAAGAPATHVYAVRVEVSIDAETATFENMDCSLTTGEAGTGLLNTATLSHNGEDTTDDACPPPPATPIHDKDVVSGPTPIGGGRYEVEYAITVSNASPSAGTYDLSDAIRYGDAVTIEAGPTLTPPAGVTPNAGWDGQTDTVIVDDQAIGGGAAGAPATHVYTVRVEVSIDAATATNESMDCELTTGESGTGLLNTATISVNGEDVDDDACPPPPGIPTHEKTVSAGPTPVGDGEWEVEYTVTVTNDDPSAATYDLEDAFRFGGAVTIEGDPVVENVTPGDIDTLDTWNGQDQTLIVDDQAIAAGTTADPEVHTYRITVTISLDETAVTFENSDCTLGAGESGSGLLNESSLTVNDVEDTDDACPDPPAAPTHTKDVVSGPTAIGGGRYEVEYQITVTNPSAGAGEYDLSDELTYGEAITIEAGPTLTPPAGVTPNAGWDGQTDTVIVDDQAIGAGAAGAPATHVYTVRVEVSIDAETATFENTDCTLGAGESGTGLLNTATLSHNGEDTTDDACPPPPGAPSHDKDVVSGPTPIGGGRYELVYEIVVTNPSAGPGEYDLSDTLRYGDAVTIEAGPTLTPPAGVTPNAGWDGQTDTVIVDGQAIGAGAAGAPATHVYTVRVEVSIDATTATNENMDCSLTGGESGTGLLNTAAIAVNGEETTDDACPLPPGIPTHDKEVSSGPTPVGDGVWEVEYTIEVVNDDPSPGVYDLDDAFRFGGAVSIVGTPTVAAPAGITPNPAWNGQDQTVIVDDATIPAGTPADPTVHTYTLTVQVRVDGATVTFENSDCTLDQGETGTGLLNESTMTVNDLETEDEACPDPPAAPGHDKEVVSGPTAIGGGLYEVTYEIVVTNPSAGAGDYDLSDTLQYGDAITVVGEPVLTAAPASVTPNPDWDGQDVTVIADDEPIEGATAGGPAVHTYTVTVQVRVDADEVTFENSDCSLTPGESGTGLRNTATLTHNGVDTDDDACPPPPAVPQHEKVVSSGPTELGDGRYEIGYTITVTNPAGSEGVYDLDDALHFGEAVTIEGTPVLTAPAGVTPNPAWDGIGETSIVDDQVIPAGTAGGPATHVYTVTVTASVATDEVTFENSDCEVLGGETGSGFLNTSTMTVNEVADDDEACPPPPGVLSHTKELTGTPVEVGDGRWEVGYTITVTNAASGEGTYDLDDELRYGEGLVVVDTAVVNTVPGDVPVNPGWDGRDDVVVVEDATIPSATADGPATHTYVVTVTVDAPDGLDRAALDCVSDGGTGTTGLNNHSTLISNGEEHEAAACGEVIQRDPPPPGPGGPGDPGGPSRPGSPDRPSGPGRLARTGVTIGVLVLVAVALLGAGAALLVDRRRRLRGAR